MLSSGFQVAATNRLKSPLAKPVIISIDPGKSTELVLKLNPFDNARIFKVELVAGPSQYGLGLNRYRGSR